MTGEYYDLSTTDVAIAAVLIFANGLISLLLRLDLEKRLLLAAARTVVQLSLIGYVLEWIFSCNHWVTIGGLMLVMTLTAGISAVRRTDRRFPGIWINSIIAVMVSSWVITALTLTAVIRPDVWWDRPAQFAIPLLGMILGNTLTGISLGLDRLSDHLVNHRAQVELLLTLGAGVLVQRLFVATNCPRGSRSTPKFCRRRTGRLRLFRETGLNTLVFSVESFRSVF